MVELKDIGFRHILSGISVTFTPGKLSVILGPNGAGKSTMLKIAAGLFPPTVGTVLFDGQPIGKDIAQRRAMLSQQVDSAIPLPVEEVVLMGRHAFSDRDDAKVARLALERVGMIDKRRQSVASLSGGERQLVHLARALVQIWGRTDAVLFLDEPITHLDLRHQKHLLEIVRELVTEGVTVAAVLHDINLSIEHGDHFLLMKRGKLIHDTPKVTAEMVEEIFDVKVRSGSGWQFY